MPIVIPRNGDIDLNACAVTQSQRDALWAAFVTSWLNKNQDSFAEMLAEKPAAAG